MDGPGDPAKAVVTLALDRTEPRRTEIALKESEARLRAMVELVPHAIFLLDAQGRIQFCNEEACRITGWIRVELLAMPVDALLSSLRPDQALPDWQELKPNQDLTLSQRLHCKGGDSFPVEVHLAPLGLGESRSILAVVTTSGASPGLRR